MDDDQIYLVRAINGDSEWGLTHDTILTFNEEYGQYVVTSALRYMRGFPPAFGFFSPRAYLHKMCEVMS